MGLWVIEALDQERHYISICFDVIGEFGQYVYILVATHSLPHNPLQSVTRDKLQNCTITSS